MPTAPAFERTGQHSWRAAAGSFVVFNVVAVAAAAWLGESWLIRAAIESLAAAGCLLLFPQARFESRVTVGAWAAAASFLAQSVGALASGFHEAWQRELGGVGAIVAVTMLAVRRTSAADTAFTSAAVAICLSFWVLVPAAVIRGFIGGWDYFVGTAIVSAFISGGISIGVAVVTGLATWWLSPPRSDFGSLTDPWTFLQSGGASLMLVAVICIVVILLLSIVIPWGWFIYGMFAYKHDPAGGIVLLFIILWSRLATYWIECLTGWR